MALRYVTAGESHGPQLTAIITGLPAGLALAEDDITRDLTRRQMGRGSTELAEDRARHLENPSRHHGLLPADGGQTLRIRKSDAWKEPHRQTAHPIVTEKLPAPISTSARSSPATEVGPGSRRFFGGQRAFCVPYTPYRMVLFR